MTEQGWFVDLDPGDEAAAAEAINDGAADSPRNWPALAVESGSAADAAEYYESLHGATIEATRSAVRERERADDQQLIHAVRAMDDLAKTANELAERVAEWAGSLFEDARPGIEGAREIAERDPQDPSEERVVSLARQAAALAAERDQIESYVEQQAPAVAPNLSSLAGPVLAARLIALAGGLESLAKKPSGTLQVLGAEDALFAHLKGRAPSPKHGVIFTHEYVRGTRKADRGSAARALAGKLTIAARVDYYSGDRKPELKEDLEARMARIRSRAEGDA